MRTRGYAGLEMFGNCLGNKRGRSVPFCLLSDYGGHNEGRNVYWE